MSIEWVALEKRYEELTQELLAANLDRNKRQEWQKEASNLSNLLEKHKKVEVLKASLEEARSQLEQTEDQEMKDLFEDEIMSLENSLKQEDGELEDLLYPADEHDSRSVFLEIRSGAGGQEASLFVSDLLRMYTNYALKQNWGAVIVSSSPTDLGGYREVILHVKGKEAYKFLKGESGVHRVQRVPETETSGRVHTSTATVAVLPEAEEVEAQISPEDLRIDVYRASGAGGQHVNTTDSAVRITHIPSGLVVCCQDERSQYKNKSKALKVLGSRLLAHKKKEHEDKMSKNRKDQVGSGMRAEKVRTYNFPQNRVTDHQVNLTLKKLNIDMAGELDEIVDALIVKARQDRKENI